jgi:hypothetical protein
LKIDHAANQVGRQMPRPGVDIHIVTAVISGGLKQRWRAIQHLFFAKTEDVHQLPL